MAEKIIKAKVLNIVESAANREMRKAIATLQKAFPKLNSSAAAIALRTQANDIAFEEAQKDLYTVMAPSGLKQYVAPAPAAKPGLAKTRGKQPTPKARKRA